MSDEGPKKRFVPKGGRKGGTVFPRIDLGEAIQHARRLVSKTHTAPLPLPSIYAGVVKARSGTGDVKISALRQYGLLKGTNKSGLEATDLAKKIATSDGDDSAKYIQQACIRPRVFGTLFETFHGDTVGRGQLRQRAADLKVHPDELENCVSTFIESAVTAGLATVSGDQITLAARAGASPTLPPAADTDGVEGDAEVEVGGDVEDASPSEADNDSELAGDHAPESSASLDHGRRETLSPPPSPPAQSARPHVTVEFKIEPMTDPDKLAKQLQLLREYRII